MALVTLPEPLFKPGLVLGVSWATASQLATHVRQRCQGQEGTRARGESGTVHQVSWDTSLKDPVMRKLMNESVGSFLAVQQAAELEGTIAQETLARLSRQYRAVLKDCQEELESESDVSGEGREGADLLYKLELMWELVEILFLVTAPGGLVLPPLLQWVTQHFPACEEQGKQVLTQASEAPEQHVSYWQAVTGFVLQGRLSEARNLLRLHSEYNSVPFLSMDELLCKMPSLSTGSEATPAAELEFRWRHWQVEVCSRIQEGDFAAFPELALLGEVLSGAEGALAQVAEHCETWYQWLVARLLYTQPTVRTYELSLHSSQAVDRFGGLRSMTTLDSVLLAAMEADLGQVVRELCLSLDSLWMPAHLVDLLHHSPGLSMGVTSSEGLSGGLREWLLLEYATSMAGSHSSLWQLALLYLDTCPVQGKRRAELLLERIPLNTERKALKVMQCAAERGLQGVCRTVCKVMGRRGLDQGNTSAAMCWALKSGDAKFTTFLAETILREYAESGAFSSSELLDSLGASIVVADRLTFLAKYRQFHRQVQEERWREAATLLHTLIASRLAPRYFWVTLLVDCLPFLPISSPSEQVIFSSEETYCLLDCLQDLHQDYTNLPIKQVTVLKEQEQRLRLSLAKNLALALTKEGDSAAGIA